MRRGNIPIDRIFLVLPGHPFADPKNCEVIPLHLNPLEVVGVQRTDFPNVPHAVTVLVVTADQKNYRRGEEHGSARWGSVYDMAKRYRDRQNLILTKHFSIGLDGRRHRRNLNVLVIGGTGAGKSRSHALPNILQGCCSYVITDPKAELLRKTGRFLEKAGYEVRVFDLLNPDSSFGYNPFAYVHDDKDVLRLINNLIRNTTPKGANGADPFWEKIRDRAAAGPHAVPAP